MILLTFVLPQCNRAVSPQNGDPYMSLLKAEGMQRVALQFWHVGAARNKADREAEAEARRRLLQKLLSSDSADLHPGG